MQDNSSGNKGIPEIAGKISGCSKVRIVSLLGVLVVGAAPVGSIQYELINKQFQCMVDYLSWDVLFMKSYSASDRADLSNNEDAIAELKQLGSSL